MKNDLVKTFGQIFDNDITVFRDQLLEIPNHLDNREDAERWVKQLRFLDISGVPDLQKEHIEREQHPRQAALSSQRTIVERPHFRIPVTRRKHDDGEVRYVAVSWRWMSPRDLKSSGSAMRPTFNYLVQRPGAEPHKSDFPDQHMERAIRFAQSTDITNLWIDNECIYQRKDDKRSYRNDKERGVQTMDVVYGESSASVGLLTTSLIHQHEIETLSNLLRRSIFVDPKGTYSPRLRPEVDVQKTQLLILKVLSDTRWSRGWIFLEDHLASAVMTLLIPHDESLHKVLPCSA